MAAFMMESIVHSGIGSLLRALPVVALSLPVVNHRARRLEARSASQLMELGRGDAIKRLKIELSVLRDHLRATEGDLAMSTAVAREAERVLARKELELARLTSALHERSVLADWQKTEIAALTMQVQALNDLLTQAGEEAKAVEGRHEEDAHALSEKETEIARLATALDECSVLADLQERQIAALTTQSQALNERLIQVGEESRAGKNGIMPRYAPYPRRNWS